MSYRADGIHTRQWNLTFRLDWKGGVAREKNGPIHSEGKPGCEGTTKGVSLINLLRSTVSTDCLPWLLQLGRPFRPERKPQNRASRQRGQVTRSEESISRDPQKPLSPSPRIYDGSKGSILWAMSRVYRQGYLEKFSFILSTYKSTTLYIFICWWHLRVWWCIMTTYNRFVIYEYRRYITSVQIMFHIYAKNLFYIYL